MTKNSTGSEISPNYEKWLKRSLWTIEEFYFLLIGLEPSRDIEELEEAVNSENYKLLYRLITDAERIDRIKNIASEKDDDLFIIRKYSPRSLIEWAQSDNINDELGFDFPTFLLSALSAKSEDKDLDIRERESFLKLILVLSEMAGINGKKIYPASREIINKGISMKIAMPQKEETIANKLKEARELLPK